MEMTKQEAQDSLDQIQATAGKTRCAIAASYDSGLLIMWGLIWIAAFLGTHFFSAWAGYIWLVLAGIGSAVTFAACWNQFRTARPLKIAAGEKTAWRIFCFWSFLFVYMFIWLSILRPYRAIQMNAFICTVIMFAYVISGLWAKSYYMIWLGLFVTCITMAGLYLIPTSYYCLWMAPAGGGAFLVTGIYIRSSWK